MAKSRSTLLHSPAINKDDASAMDAARQNGYMASAKNLIISTETSLTRHSTQKTDCSDIHPYRKIHDLDAMVVHGNSVSNLLLEWGASEPLQAAGLLHSLVWNCVLPASVVENACGKEVLSLCQAYRTGLEEIPNAVPASATASLSRSKHSQEWRGELHILQRIKYYMLAYESVDLALLAAADLWCHFQATSENASTDSNNQEIPQQNLPLSHQIKIVQQICKPFFEFLGLHDLKEALDEWLFIVQSQPSKKPKKQSEKQQLAQQQARRREANEAQEIVRIITESIDLPSSKIKIAHCPFLHLHTTTSETSTDSATPQPADPQKAHNIKLIVDRVDDCYHMLGHLHQHFTPVDGGISDQLRSNRLNGYRILQTAVVVPIQSGDSGTQNRIRVNFYICTTEMDAVNRLGPIADTLPAKPPQDLSRDPAHDLAHDSALSNVWWRNAETQREWINTSTIGALSETVYVFSPQGQLFEFPLGCTAVDYAYRVHSRLADRCRRFYINGRTVEPATVLHHLDLVELEYDPHTAGPTRVWLNAARTQRARTAINRFLRNHRQDIYLGQRKMDDEISKLEDHYGFHMPQHQIEQALSRLARKWSIPSINDLMGEIAASRLQPHRVLHPLFAREIARQLEIPPALKVRPDMVDVMQCCRPRVGEEIIGLTEKRGEVTVKLRIHTKACAMIKDVADPITLKWRIRPELREVTRIVMRAQDDHGLLGDAINQIYEMAPSVTLHKSEALAHHGDAHIGFVVETETREVLEDLANALRRLPDREISEVRHMSLSLTEREEFGHSITGKVTANPYTRSPVYEEGKFFGRKKEIERILHLLRGREDVIWVRGHKRMGKTSLLQYLKNTKLDTREFVPVFYDFQMLSSMDAATIFFELARAVYEELQDNRRNVNEVSAPLRELFQRDPVNRFVRYLRSAQNHANIGQIVLLIDEFSRTTDAYHQTKQKQAKQGQSPGQAVPAIDENFFTQWRGMLQKPQLNVCFVVVVQQQAVDTIRQYLQDGDEDPSWHLLEIGDQVEILPFDKADASNLIERPLRNYLEFTPLVAERIYELTGGSTFLIHAFCSKLMTHMSQFERKEVDEGDLLVVAEEFMSPHESVFAHLLDLTRNVASRIADQLALMLDDQAPQTIENASMTSVDRRALQAELFDIEPDLLRRMLTTMCERHVLIRSEADSWRFASLLFQKWLARNQGTR